MRRIASSPSRPSSKKLPTRVAAAAVGVALAGTGFAGAFATAAGAETLPAEAPAYSAVAGNPQADWDALVASYNHYIQVATAEDPALMIGGGVLGGVGTYVAAAVLVPFISSVPVVGSIVGWAGSVAPVPGAIAGTVVGGQNSQSANVRNAANDVIAKTQALQGALAG